MRRSICAFLLCLGLAAPARAEEVVDLGGMFGGGRAVLNKPAGPIRAGVVLLTGGDGYIGIDADGNIQRQGNWIVRTRRAYLGSGIASLTVDGGVNASTAVEYMRKLTPKVVVVAMSRGSLKVPGTLSQQPNGVVFASSMLDSVRSSLGSPDALPPTLVVHHQQDDCRVTPAASVDAFQAWGGGKIKTVWITGGSSSGDPCEARAWHGFIGREGVVTSAISRFVLSLR